ncbi:MAG: hypothetical protein AB8B96_19360 [Lysobacterales bacterium]
MASSTKASDNAMHQNDSLSRFAGFDALPNIAKLPCWMLIVLLNAGSALAQNLTDFPRNDDALLLEYDRYSLKLHRPDTTPMLRIYGSGRVQVYFSALTANPGLYETQLNQAELMDLFQFIQDAELHSDLSEKLAETVEEAVVDRLANEYYYSSDATLSVLNYYLDGATQEPVLAENLQANHRRFPGLKNLSDLANLERRLLKLTSGKLGAPVADAKTIEPRKQP